ncbi:hypothetical protein [Natrialba swarupiae]|uniref:hypothetical protein n=1 Tax=Natrialba swarupiae TaxID=2448032 RepID=UPI001EE493D9|nr:hypothetical protein [Natrialba swarupiae]
MANEPSNRDDRSDDDRFDREDRFDDDETPTVRDPGRPPDGDGSSASGGAGPGRARSPGVLSRGLEILRTDPWLVVPFLVAGVVLSLVDALRLQDPIPAIVREPLVADGIDVQIEFVGYPAGATQTGVRLESLVGLEIPYLVWGVGLSAVAVLVVVAAGVLTITRSMDGQARLRGFVSLLGFALGVDLVNRALGSIDLLQGMGLFGLVWLAIYLYLFVRLFAVPGLVVDGRSLPAALEESFELTAGRGWSIFGLILLFGLGAWLLAAVPHVGAAASSAIVAPVHAAVIVAFLEQAREDG